MRDARITNLPIVRTRHLRFDNHASKRIVRNRPALICAIPIRSLRTKWSQTKNGRCIVMRDFESHHPQRKSAATCASYSSVCTGGGAVEAVLGTEGACGVGIEA